MSAWRALILRSTKRKFSTVKHDELLSGSRSSAQEKAERQLHETTGPVPFAIGYNRSQGEGLVYGCMLLGLIMVVVGIAADLPLLSLAALVPLGIAYWHYPMVEKGHPQLGANEDGLFVERIGFINWAAVHEIDIKRTSVRNIILVRLEIQLNCPLKEAIKKIRPCRHGRNSCFGTGAAGETKRTATQSLSICIHLQPIPMRYFSEYAAINLLSCAT